MIRGCLLVCSLVVATGCMKQSATYCDKHAADDPQRCPPGDAAGGPCTSSNDCVGQPEALVCNTGTSTCVECNAVSSQTSACVDDEPVCGDNDACRPCRLHTECESGACLPDGRCGSDANVAFVDAQQGTNGPCTIATPCSKVSDALGLMPRRPYVKITGTLDENISITDRDVTFIAAPDARLVKGSGTLLTVAGSSKVAAFDLQIGDIASSNVVGVEVTTGATGWVSLNRVRVVNNSRGAIVINGGSLSLQRSIIADNPGGGVVVRASASDFAIHNNVIIFNGRDTGGSSTLLGGVLIEVNSNTGTVEFNTIAYNESNGLQNRAGIACYGDMNKARGNLVYGNHEGLMGPTATSQSGGDCQFGNTFSAPSGDLGFKNPSTTAFDPHLTATSPTTVRDAAGDCSASVATDIDGDVRPVGTGCEIGADEFAP